MRFDPVSFYLFLLQSFAKIIAVEKITAASKSISYV
jgi:hypothetical protein